MKTLHLNLKKKWFDMILSGIKREEYRELTPYFKIRMSNVKKNNIRTITFSNGYSKNRPQFVIELEYISIRTGIHEWGAEGDTIYFVLHLGKIIKESGCKGEEEKMRCPECGNMRKKMIAINSDKTRAKCINCAHDWKLINI